MAGTRTGSAGCRACLLHLRAGMFLEWPSPFSRTRDLLPCFSMAVSFCSGSRSGASQWNKWSGKETLFPEGAHFSPGSSARCFVSASARGAPLACPVRLSVCWEHPALAGFLSCHTCLAPGPCPTGSEERTVPCRAIVPCHCATSL